VRHTLNGNLPLLAAMMMFVVILPAWRYIGGPAQTATHQTVVEKRPPMAYGPFTTLDLMAWK